MMWPVTLLALFLVLAGCGHIVLFPSQLLEHERDHCREWGIPESKWVYEYSEDAARICQDKTGLIFVDACAEVWSDGTCRMFLPK